MPFDYNCSFSNGWSEGETQRVGSGTGASDTQTALQLLVFSGGTYTWTNWSLVTNGDYNNITGWCYQTDTNNSYHTYKFNCPY